MRKIKEYLFNKRDIHTIYICSQFLFLLTSTTCGIYVVCMRHEGSQEAHPSIPTSCIVKQ